MKRIRIFDDDDKGHRLQIDVNNWLAIHGKSIIINHALQSESAGHVTITFIYSELPETGDEQ